MHTCLLALVYWLRSSFSKDGKTFEAIAFANVDSSLNGRFLNFTTALDDKNILGLLIISL